MSTIANPLAGWTVDRAAIRTVGFDLQRPECILAEADGTLWTADARGGVMRIDPDGTQTLVAQTVDAGLSRNGSVERVILEGTLPNGLAFDRDGNFLIANFGTDKLESMTRDGVSRTLLDSIDGRPLGKANFPLRDSRDRIYMSVLTRLNPWTRSLNERTEDGYVVLIDEHGPRIVAEGFMGTNEIRLDAAEEWLYVVESNAKRISRLRVQPDGSLTDREVFVGPDALGRGFPDGFAFDAFGNLWVAMIMADRLVAVTPDGEVIELLDDGDPEGTALVDEHYETHSLTPAILARAQGTLAPWMASVTFGGPDLRTVYVGSLLGTTVPHFRSPVPGLPLVHWA